MRRFFSIGVILLLGLSAGAVHAAKVSLIRTPDEGIQPQAAIDAQGTVHLIYYKGEPGQGDVFYVHRKTNDDAFSKPIRVNHQPGSAIAAGSIRGAQLAIGKKGRVHVAWDGMGKGAKPAVFEGKEVTPLFYTRLNDAGTEFEVERNVITYAYGLDGGSSVAADDEGNVYVMWHGSKPGNTQGEAGRALFVARSLDEGRTFSREKPALDQPTGACACCGMRAFADSKGNVFAFYRAAIGTTNRDETLLMSRNRAVDFTVAYSHGWKLAACPMSSATLSEANNGILAAGETHGRVFFVRLDPETGKVSSPISPERKAKHPVAIGNPQGDVLLAWTEGTGWNKGGSVAWQIFDSNGKETAEAGRSEGVPVWSLLTAFAKPDGSFVIVY